MRRTLSVTVVSIALLVLVAPPALARGPGGGHGKWGGHAAFAKAPSGSSFRRHMSKRNGDWHPPGWDKGKKTGWRGADEPPGWDKGKKTGWGDGDKPPGLSGATADGRGEQRPSETVGQDSER